MIESAGDRRRTRTPAADPGAATLAGRQPRSPRARARRPRPHASKAVRAGPTPTATPRPQAAHGREGAEDRCRRRPRRSSRWRSPAAPPSSGGVGAGDGVDRDTPLERAHAAPHDRLAARRRRSVASARRCRRRAALAAPAPVLARRFPDRSRRLGLGCLWRRVAGSRSAPPIQGGRLRGRSHRDRDGRGTGARQAPRARGQARGRNAGLAFLEADVGVRDAGAGGEALARGRRVPARAPPPPRVSRGLARPAQHRARVSSHGVRDRDPNDRG